MSGRTWFHAVFGHEEHDIEAKVGMVEMNALSELQWISGWVCLFFLNAVLCRG